MTGLNTLLLNSSAGLHPHDSQPCSLMGEMHAGRINPHMQNLFLCKVADRLPLFWVCVRATQSLPLRDEGRERRKRETNKCKRDRKTEGSHFGSSLTCLPAVCFLLSALFTPNILQIVRERKLRNKAHLSAKERRRCCSLKDSWAVDVQLKDRRQGREDREEKTIHPGGYRSVKWWCRPVRADVFSGASAGRTVFL
ncbi:hypothetical protein PAMP_006525 [Pampus punctatissimus]